MDHQSTQHQRVPPWRNVTFLKWALQLAVLGVVVLILYLMISQANRNLRALGLDFSFDFLDKPVNFPIAEGITKQPESSFHALKTGIINMLRISVSGILAATVLGVMIGIGRLSSNWIVNKVATGYIETIRNIPLLVQIIFWRAFGQLVLPELDKAAAGPIDGWLFISKKGVSFAWLFPADGFWQWLAFLTLGFFVARIAYRRRMRLKEERGAETYAISWGVGAFLLFLVAGWFVHPVMGFLGWLWDAVSWFFGILPLWSMQLILAALAVSGGGLFVKRFLDSRRTPAGLAKLTDDDWFRIVFAGAVGLAGAIAMFLLPGVARTLLDWGERFFAFFAGKFEWLGRGGSPLNFSRPEVVQPGAFSNYGTTGLTMTLPFFAVWTGVTLYTAAFIAEVVRGGVLAVAKGQSEAGLALGLRRFQLLRFIILPQAFRIILPPLGNQYLNLAKNTSLAVAVAYPDIVAVGTTVFNQTGRNVQVILIWMGFYLTVSLTISAFINYYNRRLALVER
ncbi:MAG: ABC transporter permease subunit [Actinobacteria bacterium]|nr:ABC transporter permease subunit [Actinomycetota bacterium]